MAKKTKEQIISEMTLEITELELNLTSAENCYKASEYNLDEIKKIISKQDNELQSLRIDKKEMQKKNERMGINSNIQIRSCQNALGYYVWSRNT